jgi:hypothetical protein
MAMISIDTFLSNPLFGAGGDIRSNAYIITGGHSSLFDYLAIMGLLGGGGAFAVLILIMLKNAIINHFVIEKSLLSAASLASMIALIISGIANPYWYGPTFWIVCLFAGIYRTNELQQHGEPNMSENSQITSNI